MRSTLFHRLCFLLSASPLSATVDIISALSSFVNPFLTIFLSFLHYRQIFYIILYSILFLMPFHYYSAFYTLNPSSYTYILYAKRNLFLSFKCNFTPNYIVHLYNWDKTYLFILYKFRKICFYRLDFSQKCVIIVYVKRYSFDI